MTDVLLTGATGTVGAAILRGLFAEGRSVRALIRPPRDLRGIVPEEVEVASGDITDPVSVEGAIEGCSTVFHAAGIPEQWRLDPDDFKRINAEGTQNMVDAALAAGVERFVYTSTIDVFEWTPGVPFDESTLDPEPRPTHYEFSKQEADRAVVEALDRGLNAVFLHPSAVYGPAPVLAAGLNDFLVRVARRKIPAVLPGGMPVVHAEDVAAGHLRAERDAPPGGRYILSGPYLTLREIAEAVKRAHRRARVPPVMPTAAARALAIAGEGIARVTKRPPLIAKGELHFVTSHPVPDASRAREELGWESRDFDAGVASTLEDFRAKSWL